MTRGGGKHEREDERRKRRRSGGGGGARTKGRAESREKQPMIKETAARKNSTRMRRTKNTEGK